MNTRFASAGFRGDLDELDQVACMGHFVRMCMKEDRAVGAVMMGYRYLDCLSEEILTNSCEYR